MTTTQTDAPLTSEEASDIRIGETVMVRTAEYTGLASVIEGLTDGGLLGLMGPGHSAWVGWVPFALCS